MGRFHTFIGNEGALRPFFLTRRKIEFSQAEKLQEAEDEDVLRISERLLAQNQKAYEVLAQ